MRQPILLTIGRSRADENGPTSNLLAGLCIRILKTCDGVHFQGIGQLSYYFVKSIVVYVS